MKIQGKKIEGPNYQVVTIPRTNADGESFDITFHAQAVLGMEAFDEMVPAPHPPTISYPDGTKKLDFEDKNYLTKLSLYAKRKTQYIIIKSLEATPDLEWETININDPATWDNFDTELKASGFTEQEQGLIARAVIQANALDEEHIEEARKRFLAGQKQAREK